MSLLDPPLNKVTPTGLRFLLYETWNIKKSHHEVFWYKIFIYLYILMSFTTQCFAKLKTAANPSDYIRNKKSLVVYCGGPCAKLPRCDCRGNLISPSRISCGENLLLNRAFRILRQPLDCWKATFNPRDLYAALYIKENVYGSNLGYPCGYNGV